MKQCEATQNDVLLAMDGVSLPKASVDHLVDCAACRAFQESLQVVDGGNQRLNEPPLAVDHAVLAYARHQSKGAPVKRMRFSQFVQYAAAASLVALLSLSGWHVCHREAPTGSGAQTPITVAAEGTDAWRNDDLTKALGDMVATADSADKEESAQVDTLFADESNEAIADTIEKQIADIQADLYVVSLAFDKEN